MTKELISHFVVDHRPNQPRRPPWPPPLPIRNARNMPASVSVSPACLPIKPSKISGGAGETAERDCACARQARQFVVVSGYLSTCSMPCVSSTFSGSANSCSSQTVERQMELVSRAQVYVVIPAYNEGTLLSRVVTEVKRAGYAVVVVDDGSTDSTADHARAAGATVVRHPFNLG